MLWRRGWDSNSVTPFRLWKLQILRCRQCHGCRRCRGALHAIARTDELSVRAVFVTGTVASARGALVAHVSRQLDHRVLHADGSRFSRGVRQFPHADVPLWRRLSGRWDLSGWRVLAIRESGDTSREMVGFRCRLVTRFGCRPEVADGDAALGLLAIRTGRGPTDRLNRRGPRWLHGVDTLCRRQRQLSGQVRTIPHACVTFRKRTRDINGAPRAGAEKEVGCTGRISALRG